MNRAGLKSKQVTRFLPKGRSRTRKLSKSLLFAFIFILGLIVIVPFLWMVSTSFKVSQEVWMIPPRFLPQVPTLSNYYRVLTREMFPRYMLNSFFVATVITMISLFTSSISGYVFAKFSFWGRNLIFWIVLSSLMVPFQVVMITLYELTVRIGWLNSFYGLIIPMICNAFGIFMIRQFAAGIPSELIDSARLDGSSEFRIYYSIILPLMKPALGTLAIFYFMWNWDSFLWPLLITTTKEMRTLPVGLATFGEFNYIKYHYVMAGAVFSTLPVIIVYSFFQKWIIKGVTLTGLKF